MAIYHCSVKIGSRSNGASSVGSCAYREGTKIEDKKLGIVHDYSRKTGIVNSFTMTPSHAPKWAGDSKELWNNVEQIEKRKDAQLYREIVVALPKELSLDKQRDLISNYTQRNFIDRGMCATVAIHETKNENPHAHIMLTTRPISINGFEKKERTWNNKALLQEWRSDWSKTVNNELQRNGIDQRIDHRTLREQGINREPQIHLGKVATAMERKGQQSDRGERNREIQQRNIIEVPLYSIEAGIENARNMYEKYKEQEKSRQREKVARDRGDRIINEAEKRYSQEQDHKKSDVQEMKGHSKGFSR